MISIFNRVIKGLPSDALAAVTTLEVSSEAGNSHAEILLNLGGKRKVKFIEIDFSDGNCFKNQRFK